MLRSQACWQLIKEQLLFFTQLRLAPLLPSSRLALLATVTLPADIWILDVRVLVCNCHAHLFKRRALCRDNRHAASIPRACGRIHMCHRLKSAIYGTAAKQEDETKHDAQTDGWLKRSERAGMEAVRKQQHDKHAADSICK